MREWKWPPLSLQRQRMCVDEIKMMNPYNIMHTHTHNINCYTCHCVISFQKPIKHCSLTKSTPVPIGPIPTLLAFELCVLAIYEIGCRICGHCLVTPPN